VVALNEGKQRSVPIVLREPLVKAKRYADGMLGLFAMDYRQLITIEAGKRWQAVHPRLAHHGVGRAGLSGLGDERGGGSMPSSTTSPS
jgi:hypothetical protein